MRTTSKISGFVLLVLTLLLTSLSAISAEPPKELQGERADLVIQGYVWIERGSEKYIEATAQRLGASHFAWGTNYELISIVESTGDGGVRDVGTKVGRRRHIDFYRYAPQEAMRKAFSWGLAKVVHPRIVRGWLDAGLDPNTKDDLNNTMLHWLRGATIWSDPVYKGLGPYALYSTRGERMEEIARMLLEAGADPAVRGGARNETPAEYFRSAASGSQTSVPRFTLRQIHRWLDPPTSSAAPVEQLLVLDFGYPAGEVVIELDEEGSPQHAAAVRRMADSGKLDGIFFSLNHIRGFAAPLKTRADGTVIETVQIEAEMPLDPEWHEGAVVAIPSMDEGAQGRSMAAFYIFTKEQRWANETPHTRIGTVVRNLRGVTRFGKVSVIRSARMVDENELGP